MNISKEEAFDFIVQTIHGAKFLPSSVKDIHEALSVLDPNKETPTNGGS